MGYSYAIVDTGQTRTYGDTNTISAPRVGGAYSGQDAQYTGNQPSYRKNGDGTVNDLVTGLTWAQAPSSSKLTWSAAVAQGESLVLGGADDWRLPTIKELYSLIKFSGSTGQSAATSTPYIDSSVFGFTYEDTSSGSRFIDCQYWSSTRYNETTMNGNPTAFGVNFADGRIKGYPVTIGGQEYKLYALYVRGDASYGENDYRDNGDGTVTDLATGLMWAQADSGGGMKWKEALSYAEGAATAGHSDWRLPNAKELQSMVDYDRSPGAGDASERGAAIDPVFSITNIGSAASPDYPYFWSGTTHVEGGTGDYAVYQTFGKAWGYMNLGSGMQLLDVHGAGAQRSDPKSGDASSFPIGHGPQGDVVRIHNYVRLVRDAGTSATAGESLFGDDAPQSFTAGTGNDTVTAGGGNDLVTGNAGRDVAYGGFGDDTLLGGENADQLYGNAGNDLLHGNKGADTLSGGKGNDTLYGGAGDDELSGDLGADWLWGNLGDDVLTGGDGADRFAFVKGCGADLATDFSYAGGDRIALASGMNWSAQDGTGGAVVAFGGGDQVTLWGIKASQLSNDWFVSL